MHVTHRPTLILVIALLTATAWAGCTGSDPEDPSERTESKQITVPAGQGIEYKLFMREGDRIEYEWTAGRPLFYDFHGDEEGADPDEFTSHKTGTVASDGAAFVAPFTGRHGWYWENGHSSAVTLTLETSGTYSVVGFV